MKKAFVISLSLLTLSGCVHDEVYQTSKESNSSEIGLNSSVSSESIINSSKEIESSKTGNEGGSDIPWIH